MNEGVVEDIVTKFILNTCRLHPQISGPAVQAALHCARLIQVRSHDEEANLIPLITGSVAEFYIEPMLPYIGDVDVMHHWSTQLAIPRGHPPPTQLPAEFHNYVKVREIIDSHLPGYVYLELRYLLTECIDDGRYHAVEYERGTYFSNRCYSGSGDLFQIHGPAAVTVLPPHRLSADGVHCVRSLMWPTQAADWQTRHRTYGWPDSATVDRVVNNGCDVVPVAHRQCRQHKWMGKYQWRLSFSRAEIVLINSWMPVQQIVYHMLRVFMKTERLTETDSADSGTGTLSNYHIKTLMLWACELKSQNWWVGEFNIVRICVHLLHVLGDWLTDTRCQHHFISNCNLIDNSFNATNIGGQLMSIDVTWLSKRFVNNYIRKCSKYCPDNISWLFDDVSTSMKLQAAVSAAVAWRLNLSLIHFWSVLEFAKKEITISVSVRSLTAHSCAFWMMQMTKFDEHLFVYFKAIALFHVAHKSSRHGLSDKLMDVLQTLPGDFTSKRHYCHNSTSLLALHKAAKLMTMNANKSPSTMSLIAIELSKAYLCRALTCKDSDSDSIYCLANVYLAILYYTTGQYQTAIDHCTLVMRSQDHSQCSSHVVQGELLPKINDDVDNVLGLAVFYQHVRKAVLNQQYQVQHVNVLRTELFAFYLYCLFMQASSADKFKRYKTSICDTLQLFVADVLLFVSANRLLKQKCYRKSFVQQSLQLTTNTAVHDASDLVELLQKFAVEHLTTFRQIQARDFGSISVITTDFEALYAYKRGDYQQCLQLSTQNSQHMPLFLQSADVTVYPEFIQLMDDDIVSLTALTLIVNPKCREGVSYSHISQWTLSLYLMTQCQLKLRHSVTSLAQTLDYIKVAYRRHRVDWTLNRLTLKMTAHKAVMYITTMNKMTTES